MMVLLDRKVDFQRHLWVAWCHGKKLGWQGVLGVVLLFFSLCIWMIWALPWMFDVMELRANAEQLRERVAQRQVLLRQEDPQRQLDEFYALFQDADSITAALASIYSAAARNNLNLDQADYKLVDVKAGGLQRYEITLPVRGRYSQVRNFAAQALAANPGLAIAGVSLSRNSATEIGVEAQLQLLLYVRSKP